MNHAISPQARRRFDACLHGQELIDLAHDIAEALESNGAVIGEDERATILAALKGES